MTMDLERWVGTDVVGGVPSHSRPDRVAPEGWELEAIAAVERPHDLAVSPDGSRVAFVLDREGSSDIWIASLDGTGRVARLTTKRRPMPSWEDDSPSWSPTGDQIAFEADGSIWVVSAGGGVLRKLAEGWSPQWVSESSILLTVDDRDVSRLALVAIDDPWPRPITPPDLDCSSASLSRDGSTAAFLSHPADDRKRSDLWSLDVASGEINHRAGSPELRFGSPALSADGKVIAYPSEESGWFEIHIHDGSEARPLTSAGADFAGLEWSPDRTRIVATMTRQGKADLVVVDARTGEVAIEAAGGFWMEPSWAGEAIVAVYEDHRTAPGLAIRAQGATASLGPNQPLAIMRAGHLTPEEVAYESFDGLEIHGFLFRPEVADEVTVPAIVYPHGGPTSAYHDEWDGHAQYFAAKGYAWFAINYRGSTGYGRDFERADHGVWGVDDTKDCLAAADYLASLTWVDEDRIGIFGASYGSYLALCALADDPEHRFACGVAKYGDSDITTSWATSDRPGRVDLERMMGAPPDDLEAYRAGSPLARVDQIDRPLLIAHGEQDERVDAGQSAQLVDALERTGKTFEYITYPTEAHGLLRSGPQIHFYRRLERFLDWYLM